MQVCHVSSNNTAYITLLCTALRQNIKMTTIKSMSMEQALDCTNDRLPTEGFHDNGPS